MSVLDTYYILVHALTVSVKGKSLSFVRRSKILDIYTYLSTYFIRYFKFK